MSASKGWVIAVDGEAMTEEEAREVAEAISRKKGMKLYLAEIKEEINEKGQVKEWEK